MATPELLAMAVGRPRPAQESKAGFYLVLAALIFEFGRPHDLIGLRGIPVVAAVEGLLLLSVVMSGKLDLSRLQTKLWIPLLVVMVIHGPIAVNNYWALMVFKDMLLYFGVYLGIVTYVNSLERMLTLVRVWMVVLVFLAVMGIAKGGVGIGGWLADENDFCAVMNVAVPFAYFLVFSSTGVAQKIKYLAFLGTFILGAIASSSRGGFFGLAAAGAYCWYRSPKRFAALVVVGLVLSFMLAFAPQEYWDDIASSTSEETMTIGTGAERLYTWGVGLEMFFANPILGIGQGNFPWAFNIYEGDQRFLERSISGRAAHSAWVTLIAELGLAGIMIIGGMLLQCYQDLKLVRRKFAPVKSRQKHGQTEQAGEDLPANLARALEGSLIGFIGSGVFISILWYPALWILMALIVALRNISEIETGETLPAAGRTVHS